MKEKYIAQYTYALLLDDAIGKLNFWYVYTEFVFGSREVTEQCG